MPSQPSKRFALFDYGFRTFFLLASLYAALDVGLWGLIYAGLDLLPADLDPILWHAHEMFFGFASAVIAGFLLTAVPNWTGVPARKGTPLILLAILWALGRPAFLLDGAAGAISAIADLAFIPALLSAILPPLIRAKAARQIPLIAALALLFAANLLVHAEHLGLAVVRPGIGASLALYLILVVLTIMGGRVIPSFTANALMREGREVRMRTWPWLEHAALIVTAALIVLTVWPGDGPILGLAALIAGLLQAARLSGWQGLSTRDIPILWVLHLGYAWLALGLALKGVTLLFGVLPPDIATHALTAGAIGTLTLGMMSRVALGHTGRPLVVARVTVAAYGFVTLAALARTLGPAALPDLKFLWIDIAASSWALAFALYAAKYWPILARPRADESR